MAFTDLLLAMGHMGAGLFLRSLIGRVDEANEAGSGKRVACV